MATLSNVSALGYSLLQRSTRLRDQTSTQEFLPWKIQIHSRKYTEKNFQYQLRNVLKAMNTSLLSREFGVRILPVQDNSC